MASDEDPHMRRSRDARDRFDAYFPVVIFGTLTLAVQSALWSSRIAAKFEIGGWALLVIAGIASLLRLESGPDHHTSTRTTEHVLLEDLRVKSGLPDSPARKVLRIRVLTNRLKELTSRSRSYRAQW